MEKVKTSDGKTCVVMCDYRHFKQSGNAAGGNSDEHDVPGEIHGGNTPEERLVPVVIIRRKRPLPPLTCKACPDADVTVRRGHIETVLEFNREVYSLEVSIGALAGTCERRNDGRWKVSFDDVSGDEFNVSVVANNKLMQDEIVLKAKTQGLKRNDGLGGLP